MKVPRLITFYLPQFHPIPENDVWWGKGFTDWNNVQKGKPRYIGHYQPHIPSELGYYDLRDEQIRINQANLANEYGIHGFCYYHYWFNGKLLLEFPFNEVLSSGKPDFPFCLCWANENWTRAWDGLEKEVLIKQDYQNYSVKQHSEWLNKAFNDKRYIRVENKPLFLIYNPYDIPDICNKIIELRNLSKSKNYCDIFLCAVKSINNQFNDKKMIEIGFDAIVDFIPNGKQTPHKIIYNLPRNYLTRAINKFLKIFNINHKFPVAYVYSYKSLMKIKLKELSYKYKLFPCIIPEWDNTSRRKDATVIENDNVKLYKYWLKRLIKYVQRYNNEEQIIFINAWNEWAEGCHLEPDVKNGRKFLEATFECLNESEKI